MAVDVKTGQAIYSGAPSVGLRNVGSYQISGEPWISGSGDHPATTVKRYQFPFVAREISVHHSSSSPADAELRMHFVSGSLHDFSSGDEHVTFNANSTVYVGMHYVSVPEGSTVTFKAKCKEVYVGNPLATGLIYTIMADLTNIPTRRMYELTGSGHTDIPSGF